MHAKSLQSCPIPCHPGTVTHQGPCPWGFSKQEYLSGLPCSPPGDLPDPRIEPSPLMPPAWAGGFFTTREAPLAHSSSQGPARAQRLGLLGQKIWGSCAPTLLTHGAWPPQEGGVTCREESQDQRVPKPSLLCADGVGCQEGRGLGSQKP